MRKYLNYCVILFLLCFSFTACKKQKHNQELINKLASVENGLPSPYFNYYLYFKMDDSSLLETNIVFIYKIYKDCYSTNNNFSNYLKDLFSQKKIIKIKDVKKYENQGYFVNISKIDESISRMDIEDIKKKFLEPEQQSFILMPNKINAVTVKTILYKMFTDGYLITLNDYGGGFYHLTK